MSPRYLHTMVRVGDLAAAQRFFCDGLGLVEVRRSEHREGRFTLVFLAAPDDLARHEAAGGGPAGPPMLELTWNWDERDYTGGRNFGHVAYQVDDVYAAVERLAGIGVAISRPPRDGRMAFVRSPDGISVELLQKGPPLPAREPWVSAPNIGVW